MKIIQALLIAGLIVAGLAMIPYIAVATMLVFAVVLAIGFCFCGLFVVWLLIAILFS